MSDGDVVFKKGERTGKDGSPLSFAYVIFEDVLDAYAQIRVLNTNGYDYDGQRNAPINDQFDDHWRLLIPYILLELDTNHQHPMVKDKNNRTNCSTSTANAMAVGMAHGNTKVYHKKVYALPISGDRQLSFDFYKMIQMSAGTSYAHWYHGAAEAVRTFNLGERVHGHALRRGDMLQMSWSDFKAKKNDETLGDGHSVFVYHARKISDNVTRFCIISSQIDTFGVGVRINPWSLAAGSPLEDATFSGGEKISPRHVDHQEVRAKRGFEDPDFVQYALTHGRYYNAVDKDDDELGAAVSLGGPKPVEYFRCHVSRPRRPFPCFPISLQALRSPAMIRVQGPDPGTPAPNASGSPSSNASGSSSSSSGSSSSNGSGSTNACQPITSADDAFDLYYANNESGSDGFFPVGADRTWHTGIHLYPQDDPNVYAAFDGRVVCARMGPPDPSKWPLGSGNFVMLKHTLQINGSPQDFYTLYVHLEQAEAKVRDPSVVFPGDGTADARLAYPWMRDIVLAPSPDAPEFSTIDPTKLHLRILKLPASGSPLQIGGQPINVGDIFELDPDQQVDDRHPGLATWLQVGGPKKNPIGNYKDAQVKRVAVGQNGIPGAGDGATGSVSWWKFPSDGVAAHDGFPYKFAAKKKLLDQGEVVDFWDEEIYVGAGEPIGRFDAAGMQCIHFEVFSESFIPCWATQVSVTNDDPKMHTDRKTFGSTFWDALSSAIPSLKDIAQHIMNGSAHQDDTMITRQEIIDFHQQCADRVQFRDLVVQCPSHWSEAAGWDQFAQNGQTGYGWMDSDQLNQSQQQIQNYVFWTKDLQSKGLPQSMSVVFYHPLRFLQWIDSLRQKEAPATQGDDLHFSVYEKNHRIPGGGGGGGS
jgi:hypothetical protein